MKTDKLKDEQAKDNIVQPIVMRSVPCANCKELVAECACMRNICIRCKRPVGNITFTVCDDCWSMDA